MSSAQPIPSAPPCEVHPRTFLASVSYSSSPKSPAQHWGTLDPSITARVQVALLQDTAHLGLRLGAGSTWAGSRAAAVPSGCCKGDVFPAILRIQMFSQCKIQTEEGKMFSFQAPGVRSWFV